MNHILQKECARVATFSSFLTFSCFSTHALQESVAGSRALLSDDFTHSFSLGYARFAFGTGKYSKSQREQLFPPRFQHLTNLQHHNKSLSSYLDTAA